MSARARGEVGWVRAAVGQRSVREGGRAGDGERRRGAREPAGARARAAAHGARAAAAAAGDGVRRGGRGPNRAGGHVAFIPALPVRSPSARNTGKG